MEEQEATRRLLTTTVASSELSGIYAGPMQLNGEVVFGCGAPCGVDWNVGKMNKMGVRFMDLPCGYLRQWNGFKDPSEHAPSAP